MALTDNRISIPRGTARDIVVPLTFIDENGDPVSDFLEGAVVTFTVRKTEESASEQVISLASDDADPRVTVNTEDSQAEIELLADDTEEIEEREYVFEVHAVLSIDGTDKAFQALIGILEITPKIK